MNCWICENNGSTGEHLIKKSDLKSLFGHVSQTSPLYLHTKKDKNVKLKSIKKDPRLKSDAPMCGPCNNSRTSKFDRAWGKLSNYLLQKSPPIKKGDIIKLEKVFPGSVKISMLRVHLYFVKLFGCAIVENKVSIDIDQFRKSLLNEKSVKNVYLAFWESNGVDTGYSDMEVESIEGKCVYAAWFYTVGALSVLVIYATPSERRLGQVDSWHPLTITKRVKIGGKIKT